ncbi:MAG: diguanylate cyclase [Treponema sp.]|nr:diguanylate cyclase [Treponema sp.]
MSGFSEADPKFGYSYEYMQTLAAYTGWDYEYVYGDWDVLYTALLNGDIDLLSDVSRTPEREEVILYPDYIMGQETYYLYTNNPELQISTGDFSTWKDKKIGLRKDCYQYQLFMEWQKDKNLDCEYIEFTTADPYTQMFNDGEFDMLLEIDMVAEPFWDPVQKIGSSDFYLCVTKNRRDILDELNLAFSEIFATNPYYNNILWLKYFSDTTVSKSISPREAEWLEKNSQIIVGCLYDDLPFSSLNKESNSAEGLVVEMMDYFYTVFCNQHQNILYALYNDYQEMLNDLKKGALHMVVPAYRNLNFAESENLILSEKFTTVIMGYAFKENKFDIPVKLIAIPNKLKINNFVEKSYPGAKTIVYDTFEDCLNAVYNDEVDATIFNIYKMRSLLAKNKKYKKLHSMELSNHYDMAFLFSKENTALLSMINKMLMLIPEENSRSAMDYYSSKEMEYTRSNFVRDYLGYLILAIIVFAFVLMALIFSLQRINEYINHDTLTKLLNRRKLDKYVEKYMHRANDNEEPFCLMLFDLDNFKHINDSCGHAFGDKVLISVADAIRNGISSEDYAFRWGGEEFLVICNGDKNKTFFTAERIRQTIDETVLKHDGIVVHFTTTIGISIFSKGMTYKDLFKLADDNLYKGKRSGKNQVIV